MTIAAVADHDLRQAVITQTLVMTRPPEKLKQRLDMLRHVLHERPVPAGPEAVLVVRHGEAPPTQVFRLGDANHLGSGADNELQLEFEYVSRKHCQMVRTPHGWLLEDLCSTNGTYVNGHRVERQILKDGDVIQVGGATIVFFRDIADPTPGDT